MTRTVRFLAGMCCLGTLARPALASSVGPLSSGALVSSFATAQLDEPECLSPSLSERLQAQLKRLGLHSTSAEGTIGVIVSTLVGDARKSTGSVAENELQAAATQALVGARAHIVAETTMTRGLTDVLKSIETLDGKDSADAFVKQLQSRSEASWILDIVIMASPGSNVGIPMFRWIDCRATPARVVFEEKYKPLAINGMAGRPNEDAAMQRLVFAQLVRQAVTQCLTDALPLIEATPLDSPQYTVLVSELSRLEFDRVFEQLQAIQKAAPDRLAEIREGPVSTSAPGRRQQLFASFSGPTREFRAILNEAAEKAGLRRRAQTTFDQGSRFLMYTFALSPAPWERFVCDVGERRPLDEDAKIGKTCNPGRQLSVTVIAGSALGAVRAVPDDRKPSGDPKLVDTAIARSIGDAFRDAGFKYIPAERVIEQLKANVARTENLADRAGTREALARLKPVDFVVMVLEDPNSNELQFQLLRLAGDSADQIGFIQWPDKAARLYPDQVDAEDTKSVSRYIAGNLIAGLADDCEHPGRRTIRVLVKNSGDPTKMLALVDWMKQTIPDVSVSDVFVEQPVAGFSINTTGDADTVIQGAIDHRARLGWPLTVESANEGQIIFNLDFKLAPPPAGSADVTTQVTEKVMRDDKSPLRLAMDAGRSSVWVIGFELPDGRFIPIGTGWTVRQALLATNAHVVAGVREQLESLARARPDVAASVHVVAMSGDGQARRLELDAKASRSHPLYPQAMQLFGRAGTITPCDVGLIPVSKGDAGVPLRLASKEEIASLQPLDPVGYLGYPMESRAIVTQRPTLTAVLGAMNAVTDEFMQPSQDGSPELLHYDVANAGGASGSPVFGPTGAVIGLNSAGDVVGNIPIASIACDGSGNVIKDKDGNPTVAVRGLCRVPIGFSYAQGLGCLVEMLSDRPTPEQARAIVRGWDARAKDLKLVD